MLLHCLFWNLLLGWSSLQSMTSTLLGTRTRSTTSAIGSWTNCCLTLCPGDGSAFFFGYLKRGRHHETTLLVKKKTRQSSHKDVFRIRMYLYVQCWKQICASYTRYVYVYIYIYIHILHIYTYGPPPLQTRHRSQSWIMLAPEAWLSDEKIPVTDTRPCQICVFFWRPVGEKWNLDTNYVNLGWVVWSFSLWYQWVCLLTS